jgi:hypothetical protein
VTNRPVCPESLSLRKRLYELEDPSAFTDSLHLYIMRVVYLESTSYPESTRYSRQSTRATGVLVESLVLSTSESH